MTGNYHGHNLRFIFFITKDESVDIACDNSFVFCRNVLDVFAVWNPIASHLLNDIESDLCSTLSLAKKVVRFISIFLCCKTVFHGFVKKLTVARC